MNGAFSRAEAAEYLGISIETLAVWLHRSQNPIPYHRVGLKYVIPCAALERWQRDEHRRKMEKRAQKKRG